MLLDESHLQLVVDVLKEANFNDEDCYWLGQELGVYDERVGHIYPGVGKTGLGMGLGLGQWAG